MANSGWRVSRRLSHDRANELAYSFLDIELDDVVLFVIGKACEGNAAIKAGFDFLHVFLEALERVNRPIKHNLFAAKHVRFGFAQGSAIPNNAARHQAKRPDLERLTHLGVADPLVRIDWLEQALERLVYVLDQLVDDIVLADVHAARVGHFAGRGVHAYIETDDNRLRGDGEHNVALVDVARRSVQNLDLDLFVAQLFERIDERLNRALAVGLDDQGQLLDFARLNLRVHIGERHRANRAGYGCLVCFDEPLIGDGLGDLFVLDHLECFTGVRNTRQAQHLNRRRGRGLANGLAL